MALKSLDYCWRRPMYTTQSRCCGLLLVGLSRAFHRYGGGDCVGVCIEQRRRRIRGCCGTDRRETIHHGHHDKRLRRKQRRTVYRKQTGHGIISGFGLRAGVPPGTEGIFLAVRPTRRRRRAISQGVHLLLLCCAAKDGACAWPSPLPCDTAPNSHCTLLFILVFSFRLFLFCVWRLLLSPIVVGRIYCVTHGRVRAQDRMKKKKLIQLFFCSHEIFHVIFIRDVYYYRAVNNIMCTLFFLFLSYDEIFLLLGAYNNA